MTERRPHLRLWLAALLLTAQTLVAWHGPSHILDGHGHGPVAQQDCQALHGHGLACAPTADLPPARFTPALAVTPPVGAPDILLPRVHPARAPPVFS
ncbi:hypothetical protein [Alloalcanivorax gelatiniphagus]|uniref:DUF2946 domain-containing protein n=1 Tax=Alloalcanivorax gelatiniphagus TaxID=1194167 RepID=A0ABY2XKN2_9GAMM|nr:hypothetical protein [Alloalcanivorax gelatiniphagus]TMW12608.1 hypothetical protein FGS76_10250 [Alloalcanivorax gelatiniphagus]|tara:strand:- start:2011 stop:2301 length:291 start_codon:yes stop_codon:yes gene_type:complete